MELAVSLGSKRAAGMLFLDDVMIIKVSLIYGIIKGLCEPVH